LLTELHRVKWLESKDIAYGEASDGLEAVEFLNSARQIISSKFITEPYQTIPPLTIVDSILLMDISMPRLDGMFLQPITGIYTDPDRRWSHKTDTRHRGKRNAANPDRPSRVKIVALTGMSTVDDKKRAFEAGVDD
jgi:CheY-like chemotaxis protein